MEIVINDWVKDNSNHGVLGGGCIVEEELWSMAVMAGGVLTQRGVGRSDDGVGEDKDDGQRWEG